MPDSINRREFLCSLAVGCAAAAIPGWAFAAEKDARRPNILLITADDMNWNTVGVYGCKVPGITPNIDKLASDGMQFTRAHVTIAVCQPSREVLMTGRYPHRNGAMAFEPIDTDVPTLQESLHAAGYLNGIMGKNTHLAPRDKFCWDLYIEPAELGHARTPSLFYKHSKAYFEQAKAADKPFFLMANSQDPHRPFAGSQAEAKQIGTDLYCSRKYDPKEIEVPGFLPDIPDVRKELAQYYTSSHRCDEIVGEVLRALKDTEQEDNTIVMFLSDNGMSFPYSKTNCYLHSTRTPWIVRWPGHVKSGSVNSNCISGIDYMPTVLEAIGLKQVAGMDGRSFLPLMQGKRQEDRDEVFTQFNRTAGNKDFPMRCVHKGRYGYIYNAWSDGTRSFQNESQGGITFGAMKAAGQNDPEIAERVNFFLTRCPEELYDLESDPDALKNLASDPAHKGTLDSMRKRLLDQMTTTKDPVLDVFTAWVTTGKQTWKPRPNEGKRGKGKRQVISDR